MYREMARGHYARTLAMKMAGVSPLNVIIGSGEVAIPGWFETDMAVLDITSPSDWRRLFKPDSIDRLLAEHVLEHLSVDENEAALRLCHTHLKSGGLFRIAVPDGNRRDADYVAEVSPPKDGHKVLFTLDSLSEFVERAGFEVTPLEYFDENDEFHFNPWDEDEGMIYRSMRFNHDEPFKRGDLYFTSIIVDARKP